MSDAMLGPLMLDVAGTALDAEDRELLRHPSVGGLILFARNYADPAQVAALVAEVHALREPRLLVAVDHEGGRVQRFRTGFTRLPPMRASGRDLAREPRAALARAEQLGWLIGAELRAVGIDLAFAPVLDLDHGVSTVIGDRAFHRSPDAVSRLAVAVVHGMKRAGMAATGKHFPGHGGIAADSHLELPVDPRPYADLDAADLVPFRRLVEAGLPSVMMAHVVYPAVDPLPASFSPRWIREELRGALDFRGAVFCDDLCMAGAKVIGDPLARAEAALAAGCDMLPICNDRAAAVAVVDGLAVAPDATRQLRLTRLHGRAAPGDLAALQASEAWRAATAGLAALDPDPGLALDA
jgi:beta-N-acetylhexosaminidase